ncbi:hypothetical protein BCR32DRAFT_279223 [Anaeromyces robustus]|uniref:T-box domain-containing protein n=1 Tax=Anaeromyces robustus TaxID=1754192 RepID=A0A1Y1X8L1_9FUNG|nr:hypothetical protein BCR32DRAFT_279223 [Anaeromyces robustus]|eukprot:ORX82062.1 hypothetical protein BCR32DRAFT_279223 [Anaeromyces robustus]
MLLKNKRADNNLIDFTNLSESNNNNSNNFSLSKKNSFLKEKNKTNYDLKNLNSMNYENNFFPIFTENDETMNESLKKKYDKENKSPFLKPIFMESNKKEHLNVLENEKMDEKNIININHFNIENKLENTYESPVNNITENKHEKNLICQNERNLLSNDTKTNKLNIKNDFEHEMIISPIISFKDNSSINSNNEIKAIPMNINNRPLTLNENTLIRQNFDNKTTENKEINDLMDNINDNFFEDIFPFDFLQYQDNSQNEPINNTDSICNCNSNNLSYYPIEHEYDKLQSNKSSTSSQNILNYKLLNEISNNPNSQLINDPLSNNFNQNYIAPFNISPSNNISLSNINLTNMNHKNSTYPINLKINSTTINNSLNSLLAPTILWNANTSQNINNNYLSGNQNQNNLLSNSFLNQNSINENFTSYLKDNNSNIQTLFEDNNNNHISNNNILSTLNSSNEINFLPSNEINYPSSSNFLKNSNCSFNTLNSNNQLNFTSNTDNNISLNSNYLFQKQTPLYNHSFTNPSKLLSSNISTDPFLNIDLINKSTLDSFSYPYNYDLKSNNFLKLNDNIYIDEKNDPNNFLDQDLKDFMNIYDTSYNNPILLNTPSLILNNNDNNNYDNKNEYNNNTGPIFNENRIENKKYNNKITNDNNDILYDNSEDNIVFSEKDSNNIMLNYKKYLNKKQLHKVNKLKKERIRNRLKKRKHFKREILKNSSSCQSLLNFENKEKENSEKFSSLSDSIFSLSSPSLMKNEIESDYIKEFSSSVKSLSSISSLSNSKQLIFDSNNNNTSNYENNCNSNTNNYNNINNNNNINSNNNNEIKSKPEFKLNGDDLMDIFENYDIKSIGKNKDNDENSSNENDNNNYISSNNNKYIKNYNIKNNTCLNLNLKMNSSIINSNDIIKDTSSPFVIVLEDADLWKKFNSVINEMIITKSGRCLFPILRFQPINLEPKCQYSFAIDIIQASPYKYKYRDKKWISGDVKFFAPPTQKKEYYHPDSPQTGHFWMTHGISFSKIKLTNHIKNISEGISTKKSDMLEEYNDDIITDKKHDSHSKRNSTKFNIINSIAKLPENHFYLSSFFMYEPCLYLIRHENNKKYISTITFQETKFLAVTHYQNEKVNQLKKNYNPHAKGFKDDIYKTKKRNIYKNKKRNNNDENNSKEAFNIDNIIINPSQNNKINYHDKNINDNNLPTCMSTKLECLNSNEKIDKDKDKKLYHKLTRKKKLLKKKYKLNKEKSKNTFSNYVDLNFDLKNINYSSKFSENINTNIYDELNRNNNENAENSNNKNNNINNIDNNDENINNNNTSIANTSNITANETTFNTLNSNINYNHNNTNNNYISNDQQYITDNNYSYINKKMNINNTFSINQDNTFTLINNTKKKGNNLSSKNLLLNIKNYSPKFLNNNSNV